MAWKLSNEYYRGSCEPEKTSYNSGYAVPLDSTQIFSPLCFAKTSYNRER